jgi:ABC-type amino acid transport substrate-binding protein
MRRVFACAACLLAWGTARGELTYPVKVYANWAQPPKSEVGPDGALHGYAIDTARAVLRQAQVEHVFIPLPYPRAFELTKACDGLMVGVFRSPEREQFLAFSQPLVADRVSLVSRADDPPLRAVPADLAGKSHTDQSGAYFGHDLSTFTGVRLEQQSSVEVMLRKLVAHRTDAVVISPRQGVALAARKAGVPMSALRIADEPLAVVPNHIVACKGNADWAALIERLDQAIVKLRATGRFEALMESY